MFRAWGECASSVDCTYGGGVARGTEVRAADEPLFNVPSLIDRQASLGMKEKPYSDLSGSPLQLQREPSSSDQKVFTPHLTPEQWEKLTKFGQMIGYYPDKGYGKYLYPILKNDWTWVVAFVTPFVVAVRGILHWDDKRRQREALQKLPELKENLSEHLKELWGAIEGANKLQGIEEISISYLKGELGRLAGLESQALIEQRESYKRVSGFALDSYHDKASYTEYLAEIVLSEFYCVRDILNVLHQNPLKLTRQDRRSIHENVKKLQYIERRRSSYQKQELDLLFDTEVQVSGVDSISAAALASKIGQLVKRL